MGGNTSPTIVRPNPSVIRADYGSLSQTQTGTTTITIVCTQPTKNDNPVIYTTDSKEKQVTVKAFHNESCCQRCCESTLTQNLGVGALGAGLGAVGCGGTFGFVLGLASGTVGGGIGLGAFFATAGAVLGPFGSVFCMA
ncbi:MAG: hypothetical protein HAW66_09900 [Shewanella sp.]|nr:hypothetical protein [Shewanella sp.]